MASRSWKAVYIEMVGVETLDVFCPMASWSRVDAAVKIEIVGVETLCVCLGRTGEERGRTTTILRGPFAEILLFSPVRSGQRRRCFCRQRRGRCGL
jgi:hypothetical protein